MTPKSHKPTVALFAGSFNPFTVGHADIVERALRMFDTVVICVGINALKDDADSIAARVDAIKAVYADDPRVSVDSWDGLMVDFAARCGATAIVRGVRSVKDFEYERDMADANLRLGDIETVFIPANPTLSWVSSSLVRELASYGRDISDLLPGK